ncbi:ATP-binding protein [Seonamhaeicola sp. NFXS20]|uniref:ATP-binding protein n=1 Tax=Seonamhaeicola sp. NFXS20 TaxID=2816959 RepID=UPI003B8DA3C4
MENNAVLHIGNVESIRGCIVEIRVSKSKNSPHLLYNGQIIKGISVGNYVKICKGFEELIGKVDEEYITEDKLISQKEYKQGKAKIKRILRLSLIGYFENSNFKQGVKELPLIENEAFLLTEDEINKVHNFIKEIDGKLDDKLKIGVLSNETGTPIGIGVNSLFASHIGIFGNTGSGKSYTLASLYHKLFKEYGSQSRFKKNAKFLLIDFNGEYYNEANHNIITKSSNKECFNIKSENNYKKIKLLKSSFENIEMLSLMTDAKDKTQIPFLKRVINYKQIDKKGVADYLINLVNKIINSKSKDLGTKVFFEIFADLYFLRQKNEHVFTEIDKLLGLVDKYANDSTSYYILKENGNRAHAGDDQEFDTEFKIPLENEIKKIQFPQDKEFIRYLQLKIILKYYDEIVSGHSNREHISPLIKRVNSTFSSLSSIFEIVEERKISDKPLTIISLRNIYDNSLKKLIVLLVSKEAYELQKSKGKPSDYLNIIIDEAHNILSYTSQRESETWKDYRLETFEEIIKEGRKFGVFLTIASQRPSDISDTIISQLHNYFLHRLINNRDIQAVERTISYLDKVSFDALPILPTGTCVLAGLSAQVPVIIKIDKIDEGYEPFNKTIRPTDFWKDEENAQNTKVIETSSQDDEEDDLPF